MAAAANVAGIDEVLPPLRRPTTAGGRDDTDTQRRWRQRGNLLVVARSWQQPGHI